MDTARPLRDVFADLTGAADAAGPGDLLRDSGHPDLPDELVAEAVGSFADTAPIEVAEHLSPYVMAGSAVPLPGVPDVAPAGWYDAVHTAPAVGADPADLDAVAPDADAPDVAAPVTMDFGHGGADDDGTDGFDPLHHDVAPAHDLSSLDPTSDDLHDPSSADPDPHPTDDFPQDPHDLDTPHDDHSPLDDSPDF